MIPEKLKLILQTGFDKYQMTKNIEDLDKQIELAKILYPNNFFKHDKDPELEKRVFMDMPFSSHWSGTARR